MSSLLGYQIPLGGVIVNEYGSSLDTSDAIAKSNPGTGPGIYKDGAGNSHLTEAAAKNADNAAKINGGYF